MILCDFLLTEVIKAEGGKSDRVRKMREYNSSYKRGVFSTIINREFKNEMILIILDGADSLPKLFLPNKSRNSFESTNNAAQVGEHEGKEEDKEEAEKKQRKLEEQSFNEVSNFIYIMNKNHDNLKILITCRDWNKIKGSTAAISPELIELKKLEARDAAILFIKSIPVRNQLKAEHFGLTGTISANEIAYNLSIPHKISPTVSATGFIPGVIKQITTTQFFESVGLIKNS